MHTQEKLAVRLASELTVDYTYIYRHDADEGDKRNKEYSHRRVDPLGMIDIDVSDIARPTLTSCYAQQTVESH